MKQARNISSPYIYDKLHSYDKKPLVFTKRYSHKVKERFGRSRRRVEDASIDYMKRYLPHCWSVHLTLSVFRYIMSAGSPASSLSCSKVVEALCILLCKKYM